MVISILPALATSATSATSAASAAEPTPTPPDPIVYTPTTKTEPLGDNKFQLTSYSGIAFRRDPVSGAWSEASGSVSATADPEFPLAALASYVPVRFGSDDSRLVQFSWNGAPLTLSATGLDVVAPVKDVLDDARVTFPAVDPGVDIDYQVNPGGFKELIRLASASAPRSFTFHLSDATGALGAAVLTSDGGFRFTRPDANGMFLEIPPAVAYEAPVPGELPDITAGSAHQSLVHTPDGFDITVSVDEQWLEGKSFPLILDPGVDVYSGGGAACWLENGTHATTSLCAQSLVAGINATELSRSVVRFNLDQIKGSGSYVHTARFTVWQNGMACANTTPCDSDVAVRAVKAGSLTGWNYNTSATWGRYDGTNTWAGVGVSDGGGPDSCCADLATFNAPYNPTGVIERYFDTANYPALRDLVQGWVDVPASEHGFHLRGSGTAATKYVKFYNSAGGTQAPHLTVTYTPPASAPTNVSASEGNQSLTVYWTPPSDAGTAGVTGYHVSWTGYTSGTTNCTGSPCTITGLTNGGYYYVKVQPFSPYREGQASGDVGTYTPYGPPNSPPSASASATPGPGIVDVTWTVDGGTPGTANGRPISKFTVHARAGGTNGTIVATNECASCTSTRFTGLTNGQDYTFQVFAWNSLGQPGNSAFTATVRPYAVPDQATGVVADVSGAAGQAVVSWTPYNPNNTGSPPRDNGSPITNFLVRTYLSGGAQVASANCSGPSSCTISGLTNGTAYQFTVTAQNARGSSTESARSGPVTPYGTPSAPATANASATTGTVTVTWTPPTSDGGRPVDGYSVALYRTSDNVQVGSTSTPGAADRKWDMPAPNGTQVYAKVAAHNLRGYGPPTSTNNALPLLPLAVNKTVDRAAGALAGPGELLTYTVTVTNGNSAPVTATIPLTDALPNGATLASPVTLNGPAACSTACTVAAGQIQLNSPVFPANSTTTLNYTLQTAGGVRTCRLIHNAASLTDSLGAHTAAVDVTGCDAGLGLEPWWTFTRTAVGDQADLAVNAANGNAVLQAVDSTPVQAHGRLSLALRRTYNSQARTVATLPGSLGAGWQFALGETSDAAGVDVTGSSLVLPTTAAALDTLLTPLAVTLVDRDGTRHLFQPRPLSAAARVDTTALTGGAASLRRMALSAAGSGPVCIDLAYDAPKGVHLGLWR